MSDKSSEVKIPTEEQFKFKIGEKVWYKNMYGKIVNQHIIGKECAVRNCYLFLTTTGFFSLQTVEHVNETEVFSTKEELDIYCLSREVKADEKKYTRIQKDYERKLRKLECLQKQFEKQQEKESKNK